MPLHLLGKKSWNVYNTANIEKVRKDEADAAAREEAEEQRLQEEDAARRMRLLRGQHVSPPPAANEDGEVKAKHGSWDEPGRERKRRRIAGENDTEREMRYAQEDRARMPARADIQIISKKSNEEPLIDSQGHINLFPSEVSSRKDTKNAEVEAENAKKKREFEDQYTMRFSNAAGFKKSIGQRPWYQTIDHGGTAAVMPSKDVWGNEDPRRKDREEMRIVADDPLAAMRHGAAAVREADRQKAKWREEKERETRELEREERQRRRRRRRREEHDDLEGFTLDNPGRSDDHRSGHDGDPERSARRSYGRRSRSLERDKRKSHRSLHRSHDVDSESRWEAVPGGRYSSQYIRT